MPFFYLQGSKGEKGDAGRGGQVVAGDKDGKVVYEGPPGPPGPAGPSGRPGKKVPPSWLAAVV